jgi:hypothetical protein
MEIFKNGETFDFELPDSEEEDIADEFAKFRIKDVTGVEKSRLNDFIQEIFFRN